MCVTIDFTILEYTLTLLLWNTHQHLTQFHQVVHLSLLLLLWSKAPFFFGPITAWVTCHFVGFISSTRGGTGNCVYLGNKNPLWTQNTVSVVALQFTLRKSHFSTELSLNHLERWFSAGIKYDCFLLAFPIYTKSDTALASAQTQQFASV